MNHANDAYCTVCKKTTPHDAPRPGQPRKCILCGRHVVNETNGQDGGKMSETKWSDGPWKVGKDWYTIENTDGLAVAGAANARIGTDKCRANANLIAAAPDLAAACEQALATLEHHQADITYLGELRVVGELRAALAKARGETTDG